MSRREVWWVLLVAVLAVTACTDGTPKPGPTTAPRPTATNETTPPATTVDPARPSVAPEVTDPVGLERLLPTPCSALTPRQQAELGFGPSPTERPSPHISACVWERSETGQDRLPMYAYVLWLHGDDDPLAEAYQDSSERAWRVFAPRTIRGLPAVVRTNTDVSEHCQVIVGTGNGQGITMKAIVEENDPGLCDHMVTAAELVVDAARRG
ncbi:MAG TPA: DUF3558 domain-containing protein [Actinophytocola sp.]|nr:DUF3558 domain-containing protein [Actinophytocola sp.]